jgi:hypothetical protein
MKLLLSKQYVKKGFSICFINKEGRFKKHTHTKQQQQNFFSLPQINSPIIRIS